MRRTTILVAIALVLGLVSSAAAGANSTVGPKRVDKGEKIKITAKNCVDGPGFSAFIEIEVINKKSGKVVDTASVPADADGVTDIQVKMRKKGRFTVVVRCKHKFDAGGEGIFWEEKNTVKVQPR